MAAAWDPLHIDFFEKAGGDARLSRKGHGGEPTTYEPSLLGYLDYDVEAARVTRLEMIALGEVLNTQRGVRPGRHPLGTAFELVRNPAPAERVVPRGGRDDLERYLSIEGKR